MIMGIIRCLEAYKEVFIFLGGDHSMRPGIHIAESLDSFLIGIVTFIIAAGVTKVFFLSEEDDVKFPSWLNVRTFKDLKIILWEAILLTLVVVFLTVMAYVAEDGQISWSILVIPISILLLAVSLAVMKGEFKRKN
jgi:uncharacterized membrane protein YqhA